MDPSLGAIVRGPPDPLKRQPLGSARQRGARLEQRGGVRFPLARPPAPGRYPKLRSPIPTATATAPARRTQPTRSFRKMPARAVAMTTLVSRTAATDAAEASLRAASTSA